MTNQQQQPILLVFLKYPEPGKVKTRLAAEVGPEKSASLYREWIGIVLRNVQPIRETVRVVGYFDGAAADQFSEWDGSVDQWLEQPAGDLGIRLAAGFAWGHRHGRTVFAIGTDCLDLTGEHITSALELLRGNDVVFGPTTDGGYYLVGTSRNIPGFFEQVRWSSPHTFADHLAQTRRLGARAALLPQLADIDTAADWQAYEARGR